MNEWREVALIVGGGALLGGVVSIAMTLERIEKLLRQMANRRD